MAEEYPAKVFSATTIERVDKLWLVGQERMVTDGVKLYRLSNKAEQMSLTAVRLNPCLGQDDKVKMYLFFSFVNKPFNDGIWIESNSLFTEGEILAIESELYLLWQGIHANNQDGRKMSWILPLTLKFERDIFTKTKLTIEEKIKAIASL